MQTGGGVLDMAKQKDKPEAKTSPVKIDARLARKVKRIAEDRGIDASDYVSGLIRTQVERDWSKVLKKLVEAEEEEGGAR